jgi:hypothetical protein
VPDIGVAALFGCVVRVLLLLDGRGGSRCLPSWPRGFIVALGAFLIAHPRARGMQLVLPALGITEAACSAAYIV